jgi:hypothetical protein
MRSLLVAAPDATERSHKKGKLVGKRSITVTPVYTLPYLIYYLFLVSTGDSQYRSA